MEELRNDGPPKEQPRSYITFKRKELRPRPRQSILPHLLSALIPPPLTKPPLLLKIQLIPNIPKRDPKTRATTATKSVTTSLPIKPTISLIRLNVAIKNRTKVNEDLELDLEL